MKLSKEELLLASSSLSSEKKSHLYIVNCPAERYINTLISKSGKSLTRSILRRIIFILGQEKDYDWSTLTIDEVYFVKNYLLELDYAPSTINQYLTVMRMVAKNAWMHKQMSAKQYLLIQSVDRVSGYRIAGRALEVSEIFLFYHIVSQSKNTQLMKLRDMCLFGLMVECGLRKFEVRSLNCADINLQEGFFIVITKGNKGRCIYLPVNIRYLLENYLLIHPFKSCPDAPLFFQFHTNHIAKNRRLQMASVNNLLNRYRKCTGLKRFTAHDLRRTLATYLFDIGVNINMVKEVMGHECISTTSLYDRRAIKRTKALMKSFSYKI
ncbi:tyrosine-type recombinase/integrase [Suttonella ornithocola]|uniref:Tyrosine recombinase XerD n=1 Tax=Suttonella ornithocola TaxID=279832 RepID=A0A380MX01_9GAMM|nr:site-specific integrase [Suttonella ornithocola]SUO96704.1 Tyrosine recombinase XerD [Suttonella ornithocola]